MKQPLAPEQCQAKAAECDPKAHQALDPDVSRQFRDLAQQWRELAALRTESLVCYCPQNDDWRTLPDA